MIEFIQDNLYLLASASAGLCVMFATFVVVDFLLFTMARYREKYLQETAIMMEDVLLQLPPGRILDLSLALSALSVFITIGYMSITSENISVSKTAFFSMVAGCIVFPAPRLYLRWRRIDRLRKFNSQLEDALLSMSSSLKAGFSITQALEIVAKEDRYPISFEFTLLLQELRLGVAFDDALTKMSKRMKSPDFELVCVAIITARQTGGELTSILERLASVIRERVKIQEKVKALTAQGRLQAWLIGAMPFLLMFAMSAIAPDMMDAFFSSVLGIILIIGVVVMVLIGFFAIRKITNIDI